MHLLRFVKRAEHKDGPPCSGVEVSAPTAPRIAPLQATVGPTMLRSVIGSSFPSRTNEVKKTQTSAAYPIKAEFSNDGDGRAVGPSTSLVPTPPLPPPLQPTPSTVPLRRITVSPMPPTDFTASAFPTPRSNYGVTSSYGDFCGNFDRSQPLLSTRSSTSSSSSSSSSFSSSSTPLLTPPLPLLNDLPSTEYDHDCESTMSCRSSFNGQDGSHSPLWGEFNRRPSISSIFASSEEDTEEVEASFEALRIEQVRQKDPNALLGPPTPSSKMARRRCSPSNVKLPPPIIQAKPPYSPAPLSPSTTATLTPVRKVRFVKTLQLPPLPRKYKLNLKLVRQNRARLPDVQEARTISEDSVDETR